MFSPGLARENSHRKQLHCEPDAAGGNLTGFGLFDTARPAPVGSAAAA
jgi:hypothetical protein